MIPVIIEYVSRKTGDTITETTPYPNAEDARMRAIWLVLNGLAKTGSVHFKPSADAARGLEPDR